MAKKTQKVTEGRFKIDLGEEWQMTFDAIADMVFIQDKHNAIIKANKAFADALRLEAKEIIGKKCYELLHGYRKTDMQIQNLPLLQWSPHQRQLTGQKNHFLQLHLP